MFTSYMHHVRIYKMTDSKWVQLRSLEFSTDYILNEIKFNQNVTTSLRGIPRPSFLEVPDLFSFLDSPRNRFYHSSDPRGPHQNSPRTSKILKLFFEHLNMKKMKISEICRDFSVFIFVFQDYLSIFGIISEHSELWNINSMLKFFSELFWIFGGIF